jgi:hypothetical protein
MISMVCSLSRASGQACGSRTIGLIKVVTNANSKKGKDNTKTKTIVAAPAMGWQPAINANPEARLRKMMSSQIRICPYISP